MPPSSARLDAVARVATALLLVAGIALVVRGWIRSDMAAKLPWDGDGARHAAILTAAFWAAFALLAVLWRTRLAFASSVAAVVVLAALVGPVAVAATLVVFASGCALGHVVLTAGRAEPLRAEALPLCAAIGLGVFGAVFSVLALWPVNTPFTWSALLALPLLARGRAMAGLVADALRPATDLRWADVLFAGLLGTLLVLIVACALMPEVGNDALAIHLLVAAHVADFGFWHYDVQRNVLAVTPLLVDFLYAAAYMLGGEVAARLLNAGTFLVAVALVFTTVRSIASRRVALLASIVAAATPLAALESATLFIDNGWAMFVVASLVALLRFANGDDSRWLVAGGVAFGAALAAKAIAIAALAPALVLVVLAWHARRTAFPWRSLAGAVIAGLAVALPAYVIAFAKTGNPVFPLFNAIFRSPLFPPRSGVLYPAEADPGVLYRMTFYSDRYLEGFPGSLGFLPLLLLPPMLAAALHWGRREGRTMLFAALAFAAFVVANTAYLRYVYPSLFLFAIATGATLATLDRDSALLGAAIKVTALAGAVASALFLPAGFAPLRDFDVRAIVDADARAGFVARWAPTRHVVPLLNALPADRGAVGFLGAPPYLAELTRPAFVDSAYMRPWLGMIDRIRTPTDLLQVVREHDLGFLVVDARRAPRVDQVARDAARPLLRTGDATLYEVLPEARYQVERLQGENLAVGPGAWVQGGAVRRGDGFVVVDAGNALYQPVGVTAGEAYRYAVEARCADEGARLRLQVLWQVREATVVSARSVPCAPRWTEFADVLVAPEGATLAVVYATGDGAQAVEVRRVSFRSRR